MGAPEPRPGWPPRSARDRPGRGALGGTRAAARSACPGSSSGHILRQPACAPWTDAETTVVGWRHDRAHQDRPLQADRPGDPDREPVRVADPGPASTSQRRPARGCGPVLEGPRRSRGGRGRPAGAVRAAADQAVERGSTIVAVAGGDGTVRDAVGALTGTGITVGIVPCGTGNLYATSIGVPRDIKRAIEGLTAGSTRSIRHRPGPAHG